MEKYRSLIGAVLNNFFWPWITFSLRNTEGGEMRFISSNSNSTALYGFSQFCAQVRSECLLSLKFILIWAGFFLRGHSHGRFFRAFSNRFFTDEMDGGRVGHMGEHQFFCDSTDAKFELSKIGINRFEI